MPKRRVLLPAAVLLVSLCATSPATAAFPGRNGSIVYTQYRATPFPGDPDDYVIHGNIHAIAPDGTGDRAILATKEDESNPAPSPDGRRLAFIRANTLWTSNIDGTGAAEVPKTEADYPAWSADGRQVFFSADLSGIRTIDLSATYLPQSKARTILAGDPIESGHRELLTAAIPTPSPDGKTLYYVRIKFSLGRGVDTTDQIWASPLDGKQRRRVFRGTGDARTILGLDISPDGRTFAFLGASNANRSPRRLYVVGADGTGLRLLSTVRSARNAFGDLGWSPDGTKLVVSQNYSGPKRGGELDVVDAITGSSTVLRRVSKGLLDEPAWQALPAS